MSLVDSAQIIESASETVALRTNSQLESIVEQMLALQEKARNILDRAARDLELHQAECRFQRVAGKVYHLYARADGRRYFSMLAPDEYSQGPPRGYLGGFRYEADKSWTPMEEIAARDEHRTEIEKFVNSRLLPGSRD